jgi:hypothetical protein
MISFHKQFGGRTGVPSGAGQFVWELAKQNVSG